MSQFGQRIPSIIRQPQQPVDDSDAQMTADVQRAFDLAVRGARTVIGSEIQKVNQQRREQEAQTREELLEIRTETARARAQESILRAQSFQAQLQTDQAKRLHGQLVEAEERGFQQLFNQDAEEAARQFTSLSPDNQDVFAQIVGRRLANQDSLSVMRDVAEASAQGNEINIRELAEARMNGRANLDSEVLGHYQERFLKDIRSLQQEKIKKTAQRIEENNRGSAMSQIQMDAHGAVDQSTPISYEDALNTTRKYRKLLGLETDQSVQDYTINEIAEAFQEKLDERPDVIPTDDIAESFNSMPSDVQARLTAEYNIGGNDGLIASRAMKERQKDRSDLVDHYEKLAVDFERSNNITQLRSLHDAASQLSDGLDKSALISDIQSRMTVVQKRTEDTDVIVGVVRGHTPVSKLPQLPSTLKASNNAYKTLRQEPGATAAGTMGRMIRKGIPVTDAAVSEFQQLVTTPNNESILEAARMLKEAERVDQGNRETLIARSNEQAKPLASALMGGISGVPDNTAEFAQVVNILSRPEVPTILKSEALPALSADEDEAVFSRTRIIERTLDRVDGIANPADIAQMFNRTFLYEYARARVFDGMEAGDSTTRIAAQNASERIGRQFGGVEIDGFDGTVLVPADQFGIGSLVNPNDEARKKFERALDDLNNSFEKSISIASPFARPNTVQVDPRRAALVDDKIYIPAINNALAAEDDRPEGQIAGFVEWNPETQTHRLLQPGESEADDRLWRQATMMITSGGQRGFERTSPTLMYSSEFGVRSVAEFDQRYNGVDPNGPVSERSLASTMIERAMNEITRTGQQPSLRDEDERREIMRRVRRIALDHGWPSLGDIQVPQTSNDTTSNTEQPAEQSE